uniref:Uncharacterized protein n=1 Tax=Macrostomum lignano TaxID=282301 RepID=A0A1I8FNP2_9PLAT
MDESHGLIKDTEYFVALSGCSSTQCRTAGFAKFTAWQQGGGKQNLVCHHRGERRSRGGGGLRHCGRRHDGGSNPKTTFSEYIYDVLNEGQSGQTGQQPAEMQNFDAVPNSALRRFQGLRRRVSSADVKSDHNDQGDKND